jgi:hypothetical protein
VSGLLFLVCGEGEGFVIHTDAYVEGNMSVDMGVSKGTGTQQRRYKLELDSTDGTTYVGNNYESGEAGVEISYVADPDGGLFGGSLSAKEQIAVNTCNSQACRLGTAGSSFDVRELSYSTKGSFDQGSYEISAQGEGKFGTNAAEKVSTPNPAVHENNVYELRGDGVFALTGDYGFRGDVEEPGPFSDPPASSGVTSEKVDSLEQGLSISGPSSVTENTSAAYSANLTLADGTSQDVTQAASWGEDAVFANIDSDGVLSVSEVSGDQTLTISAFFSSDNGTHTAEMVVGILDLNLPPLRPVIVSPQEGETECELQFTIQTEPFSDPDGDDHAQSRWQIGRDADFDTTVLDMTTTQQLAQLVVPNGLLELNTTYFVRVRFYDAWLDSSDWSQAIKFTTAVEGMPEYALSITGPDSLMENTTASYRAILTSTDGSSQDVTEAASWGENASFTEIDSNGILFASGVVDDQTVTISAFYTNHGATNTAQHLVVIIDANLAPLKPVILSPLDRETDCDLQLSVSTEPFSDPDGDTHAQSQWQISKNASFEPLLFDVTTNQHLVQLTLPDKLLETENEYFVRVRFYDAYLKPSSWSDSVHFSTTTQTGPPTTDTTPPEMQDAEHPEALAAADPDNTGNVMVAYNGGIAIDFGPLGLWYFDGAGWSQLDEADPQWLCVWGDHLLVDFGSSGLWQYDGSDWNQIREDDPDNTGNTMMPYNDGIAADFGPLGLWYFDGADWSRLGGADPEWLCTYDNRLVIDYGALGLWEYDAGLWKKLGGANPDNTGNTMVACDAGLAIDYGDLGFWLYQGTGFTKLGAADPEWLCVLSDMLMGDYGNMGLLPVLENETSKNE